MSWRVRPFADEFKVIDVVVEGVSMLITLRDEFGSVIRHSGDKVQGLIVILQDKVQALE